MDTPTDNIRVCLRVRPLSEKEKTENADICVNFDDSNNNKITLLAKPEPKPFHYDWVGQSNTAQNEIFLNIGQPMAQKCLEGTISFFKKF